MYNHPILYDDMMWWKKDDIDFWSSIIKENKSKKILELCCGTGRTGLPLIEQGLDYYGIDLSEHFVKHFKSKITDSKSLPNIFRWFTIWRLQRKSRS